MMFSGLIQLVKESHLDKIDFSMLDEETKGVLLGKCDYVPKNSDNLNLLKKADKNVIKGKFGDASINYMYMGRNDLANFLNQYREHVELKRDSGCIQMDSYKKCDCDGQHSSGIAKMVQDPMYESII